MRGGNLVEGNFVGLDPSGLVKLGGGDGVSVFGGSDNTIGGAAPASRNVIAAVAGYNIRLDGGPSGLDGRNLVQGNYIGTDASGTALPAEGAFSGTGPSFIGIAVLATAGNTIGGATPGAGNVISGSNGNGIALTGGFPFGIVPSSRHLVVGNFIGVGADGSALGNDANGVVTSGFDNTIGGLAPGAGNVIAHNARAGVGVGGGSEAAILGNSIHSNGNLGINLVSSQDVFGPDDFGTTPNDPGDADTGANGLQNFPVLTSADTANGATIVAGALNSTPGAAFTIEFFANPEADPAAANEGRIFLGRLTDVRTDAGGNAAFRFITATPVGVGQVVTATATDAGGNTSEFFARGVTVVPRLIAVADLRVQSFAVVPDPAAVGQSLTYTIVLANDGPDPAAGVVLTASLPANSEFVATSAGTFDPADRRVAANLGVLGPGAAATVAIVVRPTAGAAGTTLTSTVVVSADPADPDPANNVGQVATTVAVAIPADTTGPTVARVDRLGFHARPTMLVLTFSEAIDPARVPNLANYRLVGPGGRVVALRSATYDATARTVTLAPRRLLPLRRAFRLTVNGSTAAGLIDLAGNLLDGDRDGRPGGDFRISITRDLLRQPPRLGPRMAHAARPRDGRRV